MHQDMHLLPLQMSCHGQVPAWCIMCFLSKGPHASARNSTCREHLKADPEGHVLINGMISEQALVLLAAQWKGWQQRQHAQAIETSFLAYVQCSIGVELASLNVCEQLAQFLLALCQMCHRRSHALLMPVPQQCCSGCAHCSGSLPEQCSSG